MFEPVWVERVATKLVGVLGVPLPWVLLPLLSVMALVAEMVEVDVLEGWW